MSISFPPHHSIWEFWVGARRGICTLTVFPPWVFKTHMSSGSNILACMLPIDTCSKYVPSHSIQRTSGATVRLPALFLGLGSLPCFKLRQTTYATTRKRARVCGRGISPLAYRRTPQRELHPSYWTTRGMFNCLLSTNMVKELVGHGLLMATTPLDGEA